MNSAGPRVPRVLRTADLDPSCRYAAVDKGAGAERWAWVGGQPLGLAFDKVCVWNMRVARGRGLKYGALQ
jgi:hypothetical protein